MWGFEIRKVAMSFRFRMGYYLVILTLCVHVHARERICNLVCVMQRETLIFVMKGSA